MTKKFLVLLVLPVLFLAGCGSVNNDVQKPVIQGELNNRGEENNISYEHYKELCAEDECCLNSVNYAEKTNSIIGEDKKIDELECIEGYWPNAFRCENSFAWCQPEEIVETQVSVETENNRGTENNMEVYGYEEFQEFCGDNVCCLESVNYAVQIGGIISTDKTMDELECPEYYVPNKFRCDGSVVWCEPVYGIK